MVNISAWNNTGRNNNDNFLFDLPIKIESLPIFNIYDFRIGQNWPQKCLIWVENYWDMDFQAEENFGENMTVTQSWRKCGISSKKENFSNFNGV